ncbi:hypothetical protein RN001_008636 [Aquatica leii]|uniref:Queuosine 5'-phosphate N-glycosylase/hydrolase n=1 Tax=Aquatica leii TaxID=1421715 RepID=A0AAN7Q5A6_9COLE|nr:hypothetical protein RN001_008636 [Aquatica leii]
MPLSPKESGKLIAELSKHVQINSEGIKELGNKIVQRANQGKVSVHNFSQNGIHPKSWNPNALDWLFVVDTLNFCFWHVDGEVKWKVDNQSGYFALCAAINRAVKEGIDILNPNYYSTITKEQLQHVLRSDTKTKLQLLDERVECLHSSGLSLIENFEGSFRNCVEQAENSAVQLLELIVKNFKCFQDEAIYQGHVVSLYKRAQILVGDVWACFKGKGLGRFDDIDEMTMFPDYRIPQTLLFFNVFEYSDELMNLLRAEMPLKNGSEMEVEIRGCSIHAVTLLTEYVKQRVKPDRKVNAILLDHFLWDYRRNHSNQINHKNLPFHKTFCIFY